MLTQTGLLKEEGLKGQQLPKEINPVGILPFSYPFQSSVTDKNTSHQFLFPVKDEAVSPFHLTHLYYYFFFFYHKVSCILGCSRTHCVAVAALELTIFPCPPPGITHLDHHDQFISKFLLKVTLFSLKSQRSILKFYLKKTKQIN